MATADATRTAYVRALPTLSRAAELIDISPAGVTRGIEELGLEPLPWGRREKHLAVGDLLDSRCISSAPRLRRWRAVYSTDVKRQHPDQLGAVNAEVGRFFAAFPPRRPDRPEDFLTELHDALPKRYAQRAEAIYRRHATSSK